MSALVKFVIDAGYPVTIGFSIDKIGYMRVYVKTCARVNDEGQNP